MTNQDIVERFNNLHSQLSVDAQSVAGTFFLPVELTNRYCDTAKELADLVESLQQSNTRYREALGKVASSESELGYTEKYRLIAIAEQAIKGEGE